MDIENNLFELACESGWEKEYKLLEPFLIEYRRGNEIDLNKTIEFVISEAGKERASLLLIATDEECMDHIPLVKLNWTQYLKQLDSQPENEERLKALVDTPPYGILMMENYLETDLWLSNCQQAPISDILRVHDYSYIKKIKDSCDSISKDTVHINIDRDTIVSKNSYNAAAKSAGVVIAAVDGVIKNQCRNAFCAIRPPGHHVGTWGAVKSTDDQEIESLGLCLLNNVAIGAAYALYNYRAIIKYCNIII